MDRKSKRQWKELGTWTKKKNCTNHQQWRGSDSELNKHNIKWIEEYRRNFWKLRRRTKKKIQFKRKIMQVMLSAQSIKSRSKCTFFIFFGIGAHWYRLYKIIISCQCERNAEFYVKLWKYFLRCRDMNYFPLAFFSRHRAILNSWQQQLNSMAAMENAFNDSQFCVCVCVWRIYEIQNINSMHTAHCTQ